MSFWQRFFGKTVTPMPSMLISTGVGEPAFTPRNYESFAKEAYQKNAIAYRCISLIGKSCGGIEWKLWQGKGKQKREIPDSPLLKLIERPNPSQGRAQFVEAMLSYFMISGNSYTQGIGPSESAPPMELHCLSPAKVKVLKGAGMLPYGYRYEPEPGKFTDYRVNQINGDSAILQMKTFNPFDPWTGMSPIEAIVYGIDQHNAASIWNARLLQNSAIPSGVFKVEMNDANPSGKLQPNQFESLKKQIDERYVGASNAGRPMLLEGGLSWTAMSLSPKDMDWLKAKDTSARDVALAFGVPPLMLNIPGDNTYSNYQEARQAFYEDTILPLMDYIAGEWNRWLTPSFNKDAYLQPDANNIEALAGKREKVWTRVQTATWLTYNEKREATGYEASTEDGADCLWIPSGQVPLEYAAEGPAEPEPTSTIDPSNEGEEEEEDPKKPKEDTEAEADDEEEAETEDADGGKSLQIKYVNPLTSGDRRAVYKAINARRKAIEKQYLPKMTAALNRSAKMVAEATVKAMPDLREGAAMAALSKSMGEVALVLRDMLNETVLGFGADIVGAGKSAQSVKTVVKFRQFAESFVRNETAKAITQIENTSAKKARAAIKRIVGDAVADNADSNAALAKELEQELVELTPWRADMIVRTEVAMASSQGSLGAAKSLGIPGMMKEWIALDDDRTRDDPSHADHLSMNGVKVLLDEKFNVQPDCDMDGPLDPSAPPEQTINCRCATVYMRGE